MSTKKRLLSLIGIAGLALAGAVAYSQSAPSYRAHCNIVGYSPQEPLGDREGHLIATSQMACRVEGGPLDGGVMTAWSINEWEKGSRTLLSGAGVVRKPGATAAYQIIEGKGSGAFADGRVTGTTGSGRGRYTLAVGAASSLAGKTYTYNIKNVRPNQLLLEVWVNN